MESTRITTRRLGIEYEGDRVKSPGIGAWSIPDAPLDCGNSGTTMRLLAGSIAGSRVDATLVGDTSLLRRPMRRLVEPLSELGADIAVRDGGTAPIRIRGSALKGADVAIPIASAQIRTAVALAALTADGSTRIDSPPGFRDHTERWLAHLGLGRFESTTAFVVVPRSVPPLEVTLPADTSSAAFLWAAAAVTPGSRIITPKVSLNPGRTGFLDILEMMGAQVAVDPGQFVMGDPVGTVTVESAELAGIEIRGDLVARALDELPLLAVVAAGAHGRTVVADAAELRFKESDRISAAVALARLAGADAEASTDGFVVDPMPKERFGPVAFEASGDHRVAMAAAVASLIREASVDVVGFEVADISWPGFAGVLESMWS